MRNVHVRGPDQALIADVESNMTAAGEKPNVTCRGPHARNA